MSSHLVVPSSGRSLAGSNHSSLASILPTPSSDSSRGSTAGSSLHASNRASTSDLVQIATGSQPLTSSTSLLDLLAPDVQSYILQHGASTRVATNTTGGVRFADETPPAAVFARKRNDSTKRTSSSPPRPPRHRSRSRKSEEKDPLISPVAASASQLADDYLAHGFDSKEPGTVLSASPSSSKLLSHQSSTSSLRSGRGAKMKAKEQQAAMALLHRAPESGRAQPIATPPLTADNQSRPSHDTASQIAAALHEHHSTLYDGGPRLFHSQSKDLLQGLDIVPPANGRPISEEGLSLIDRRKEERARKSYQGLNGASYSLTHASTTSLGSMDQHHAHQSHLSQVSSANKFCLPHAEVLDINDGFTGQVDRWPAGLHDRKPPPSMMTGPRTLYSAQTLREFDVNTTGTKPKFLLDLENYVSMEMKELGISDRDSPSITRLQIYREAFLRFIEDFTTYKPILSRIYKEYEEFLSSLETKLSQIPLLQRKLGLIEGETKEKIEHLESKWEEKELRLQEERRGLESQLIELSKKYDELHTQHSATQQELSTLQSTHQTLIVSNNTLKRALTRYGTEKNAAWDEKIQELDQNKKLQTKLHEMQLHQEQLLQEMVLLRNHAHQASNMNPEAFTKLQTENTELKVALEREKEKYQSRSAEYFTLLNLYDSSTEERKTMHEQQEVYERMKHSSTPRPQWNRLLLKHYLPDSCNIELQSSESLLDEMCSEMDRLRKELHTWELKYPSETQEDQMHEQMASEGVKREAPTHLKVRGSGLDVPMYLRWGTKPGQKIRNKNINKRETEAFIKEVWAMKLQTPEEQGGEEYKKMTLEEFLYIFLKKKVGFQEAIAHYAYSILDSLDRFRFDGDCDLFLSILEKKISEGVFVDQNAMLSGLKAQFEKTDGEYHKGKTKGRLPRKIILDVLSKFFSNKSHDNLKKVNRSLFLHDKNEFINYRALFEEDREGNQGPFMECIRDQHLAEIADYTEELRKKFVEKAQRYDGKLRLPQIREIIQVSDPSKPAKEVEAYLREGCDRNKPTGKDGKTLPDLPLDTEPIDPEEFFKNLSRRLLKRTGPPPGDKEKLEFGRRASLVFGGANGSAAAPRDLSASPSRSGRSSPGGQEEKMMSVSGSGGAGKSLQPPPLSSLRSSLRNTPASPSSPASESVSPVAPVPRKPVFSELARRISMPRNMSLANVVQAAKDAAAAAASNGTAPSTSQQQAADPPTARMLSIELSAPSNPNSSPSSRRGSISLLSLARTTSRDPTEMTPAMVRSFGRTGSLERLQSLQQSREQAQNAWEARQSAEAQAEATKSAEVLTMRREVDREDEDDRIGMDTPENDLPTPSSSSKLHSPSSRAKPSMRRVASITQDTASAARSVSSMSLHSDAGSTVDDPAGAFSPVTGGIIASRKMVRQSMRRSGGLANMMAQLANQDPQED